MNVGVRLFAEEDATAVAALIRTTLLTSNAADYPREELETIAEWYSAEGLVSRIGHCQRIVAVTRDATREVLGTAARRENHLEGFFVSPSWQGRGVGELLLSTLEDAARADAMRVLWLESSLTAVGFYEKAGFARIGEARDLGDGLVVEMRKRLDEAS